MLEAHAAAVGVFDSMHSLGFRREQQQQHLSKKQESPFWSHNLDVISLLMEVRQRKRSTRVMEPVALLNNLVSCSRAATGNRARLAHIWNVLEKAAEAEGSVEWGNGEGKWKPQEECGGLTHSQRLVFQRTRTIALDHGMWEVTAYWKAASLEPLDKSKWRQMSGWSLARGRRGEPVWVRGVKYCWFIVVTKTSQNKPDDLHLKTTAFFYGSKSCDLFLVSLEMWCNQIHLLKYFFILKVRVFFPLKLKKVRILTPICFFTGGPNPFRCKILTTQWRIYQDDLRFRVFLLYELCNMSWGEFLES